MRRFMLGVIFGVLAVAAVGGAQMVWDEMAIPENGTVSLPNMSTYTYTVATPGTITMGTPTIENRLAALESRVAALEKQSAYLDDHCGPDLGDGIRECW